MNWKWVITLLGIPTGISFGTFLPKIDGIHIGKDGKRVDATEIEKENSKVEFLKKTVIGKLDSESGNNHSLKVLVPCINGDLIGEWIKNEIKEMIEPVSKDRVENLQEMIREAANILYGCKQMFSHINGEHKKWQTLERRLKQIKNISQDEVNKEKEIQFGLRTRVKESELMKKKKVGEEKLKGIKIEFSEINNIDESVKNEIRGEWKKILINALSKVLREGRWSQGNIDSNLKEAQYKKSRRYLQENNYQDRQIRELMDSCGANCLLSSGRGIKWNPDVRPSGAAKWFEDKMSNPDKKEQKMGFKDVLLSMNFNWKWLRDIVEVAIWKEIFALNGNNQNEGKEMCKVGDWGVACPQAGIVWEKLN